MVRPVPTVTIDFGNGKTIKRTLNGNIASYICTTDGSIVDVLPGIYDPATYMTRLGRILSFARTLPKNRVAAASAIRQYHNQPADYAGTVDSTSLASGHTESADSAGWALRNLLIDTMDNEVRRRAMIHNHLRQAVVKPNEMKRWLYKEVLHADLDDPYLGLDRQISGTYPFDDHQG